MKSLADVNASLGAAEVTHKNDNIKNEVVSHYNQKKDTESLRTRDDSRIVFLRNFNNWVKSVIIQESIAQIKYDKKYKRPTGINVVDLGSLGDWMHFECA
jgi:mRNA (guanine-N7-)-methyltransferase